jgi:hypothetical protein
VLVAALLVKVHSDKTTFDAVVLKSEIAPTVKAELLVKVQPEIVMDWITLEEKAIAPVEDTVLEETVEVPALPTNCEFLQNKKESLSDRERKKRKEKKRKRKKRKEIKKRKNYWKRTVEKLL